MSQPSHEQFEDRELGGLFAQYRAIVTDPDPGANFMPELWRKIESRNRVIVRVKKLTQVFVAAAAAMCILFATVRSVPMSSATDTNGSYIDVLAEAFPAENLAAHGIIHEAEGNSR